MTASKKALRIEGILWLLVTAAAVLLAAVLLVGRSSQRTELQQLKQNYETLTVRMVELQEETAGAQVQKGDQLGLMPWKIEDLQKKGLEDPIPNLIADLQNHPELISREGVLGGTMAFGFPEKIHVLTERYVLAYFEDGHIAGWMLLEYGVARGGKITWRVIDSYLE
ncbi:hypothetical protein ACFL0G_03255 [Candidatus Zixiibacteriota bacterium]